jgi:hypothetical protein
LEVVAAAPVVVILLRQQELQVFMVVELEAAERLHLVPVLEVQLLKGLLLLNIHQYYQLAICS